MDRSQLKTKGQLQGEMLKWADNFENTCKYCAELQRKKQAGEDVSKLEEEGDEPFAFSEWMMADLASYFLLVAQRVLSSQYYIAVDSVCRDGLEVAEMLSKYTYMKPKFWDPNKKEGEGEF